MKKYIFAAFVAVLSVTCFASYSFGIDKAKKLLALGHCPKCDLSGANLTGADLSRVDLTGVAVDNTIFCNTKTPWGLDNSGCDKRKSK